MVYLRLIVLSLLVVAAAQAVFEHVTSDYFTLNVVRTIEFNRVRIESSNTIDRTITKLARCKYNDHIWYLRGQ